MIKKEVIIDNLKINYYVSADFKSDQAVVFVPGWNSPADIFCNNIEANNLLAINLPGFFGSEKPSLVWGTSEYASFLADFLTKLNIDNPILVGHSFGGAVALRYAATDNKVKKLILIGAAIVRERNSKTIIYYLGAKIFKTLFPFLAKKLRKSFYNRIGSLDYLDSGHMTDIYQKVIREDSQSYLKDIKTPVTIIWGERDLSTPLKQAHLIINQLPDSQLFILKEAGHYSFLDKKEEFQKIFSKEIL